MYEVLIILDNMFLFLICNTVNKSETLIKFEVIKLCNAFWHVAFVRVLLEMFITSCLQTILFTTDDTILELISQYDESFCSLLSEAQHDVEKYHVERPITADNGVSTQTGSIGKSSCVTFNF